VASAKSAQQGGAQRLELCDNLIEGGTTPSMGMIKVVMQQVDIPVNVMIRPRGGDFLYSDDEVTVMLEDIKMVKELNVNGVVIGPLKQDGTIDKVLTRRLVDAARPLSVTFHRAIDCTPDPIAALKDCADLGIDRVLTSGGASSVVDGIDLAKQMVSLGRTLNVVVLLGAGVSESNAQTIIQNTGTDEIHGSLRKKIPSCMVYKPQKPIFMGAEKHNVADTEFTLKVVDATRVKTLTSSLEGEST